MWDTTQQGFSGEDGREWREILSKQVINHVFVVMYREYLATKLPNKYF